MNILFLYSSSFEPTKGGVQRVSTVLAEYFIKKGLNVFYLSLKKPSVYLENHYYLPSQSSFKSGDNIFYFNNFIEKYDIGIVINQGAIDPDCSDFSYLCRSKEVKLISVVHNSPLASILNLRASKYNTLKKYKLAFLLLLMELNGVKNIILWLYKMKYKSHYTKLIEKSDSVLLLSDLFKSELQFFYFKDLPETVQSIPNPVSFKSENISAEKKENIALFVGRVDFTQKRVDLLLKIWSKITLEYPDWKLKIIGNGPDLPLAKEYCKKNRLNSVYFEGFQDPIPYYKEASLLCMTSSFEGFPMVIVEALCFGVIPIAFHSFESIYDVIKHNRNGCLIKPFNEDEYVQTLSRIMKDEKMRKALSVNCIESSRKFSLELIGDRWLELFDALLKR